MDEHMTSPVRELRLAVTVEDYDDAVRFYRDVLGLPVIREWDEPTGSGAILDAGHATLELLSVDQTALVDPRRGRCGGRFAADSACARGRRLRGGGAAARLGGRGAVGGRRHDAGVTGT